VLVAWGFTEEGERVLLSVMLGMRESHEDWLELARDLIARVLGARLLIVADGAPGLIKAVEQCWPASDRQHCAVHRVRNLLAKLPERERERVRQAYWQALDDATSEPDGKQRLQSLIDQLDGAGYTAAGECLADDLHAIVVHRRYLTRHRRRWRSTNALAGRGQTPHQGHRPLPRPDQLPHARLGRAGPLHHPRHQRHQLHPTRTPTPQTDQIRGTPTIEPRGGDRRTDRPPPGTRAAAKLQQPRDATAHSVHCSDSSVAVVPRDGTRPLGSRGKAEVVGGATYVMAATRPVIRRTRGTGAVVGSDGPEHPVIPREERP
jgi:Transposase, Mutator family